MRQCYGCGAAIDPETKVLRADECAGCGRDLRCCRNCRHYHPSAHNQCLEPMAEWVAEKEKGNFCDYFEFAAGGSGPKGDGGKSAAADAREKWKKLFKS